MQCALWVFRHQRVFCPRTRTCTHLRPLPPGGLGAADVDVPSAVPQKKGEEEGVSGKGGRGGEVRASRQEGPVVISPDGFRVP